MRHVLRILPFDRLYPHLRALPESLICRTIVQLAQTIGLETIAEGVETPLQLAFLERNDCTIAQGYLFAHPLLEHDLPGQLTLHGVASPGHRSDPGEALVGTGA